METQPPSHACTRREASRIWQQHQVGHRVQGVTAVPGFVVEPGTTPRAGDADRETALAAEPQPDARTGGGRLSDLPVAAATLRHEGISYWSAPDNNMAALFRGVPKGVRAGVAANLDAGFNGMPAASATGWAIPTPSPAGSPARPTCFSG